MFNLSERGMKTEVKTHTFLLLYAPQMFSMHCRGVLYAGQLCSDAIRIKPTSHQHLGLPCFSYLSVCLVAESEGNYSISGTSPPCGEV